MTRKQTLEERSNRTAVEGCKALKPALWCAAGIHVLLSLILFPVFADGFQEVENRERSGAIEEPIRPNSASGHFVAPVKVHAPSPHYTVPARRAGAHGVVVVEALIDKQGNVTDAKVLKSLGFGLSDQAVKAIKEWRFMPATLNGKPVDVYFNLTVNFELHSASR